SWTASITTMVQLPCKDIFGSLAGALPWLSARTCTVTGHTFTRRHLLAFHYHRTLMATPACVLVCRKRRSWFDSRVEASSLHGQIASDLQPTACLRRSIQAI